MRDDAILLLRPERADDAPFLSAMFCADRASQFQGIPGWTADQVQSLLSQQFAMQHQQFRQLSDCRFDIVEYDGVPVGRLYVMRLHKSLHIVDVALVSEVRGRGIGTSLISTVIATAAECGLGVSLEVEHFNPARRLYERLGFVAVADLGLHLEMERAADDASSADRASA